MLEMPQLNVYVDESGTNELDSSKLGVSSLFICVAVLIEDSDLLAVDSGMQNIAQLYFSGAELKSSSIGGNFERRIRVLKEISLLPFRYYALIINKDKVPANSPLQYKRTFYKYINKMLFQCMANKKISKLKVFADSIGNTDFMDSFNDYFKNQNIDDLFTEWSHSFLNSQSSRLIQLADIIAGSLGYCYDKLKKNENAKNIKEILSPKCCGSDIWPYGKVDIPSMVSPSSESEINARLSAVLSNNVVAFIEKYEDSCDADRQMQVFILKKLFMARKEESRSAMSIFSDDMIECLKKNGFEELTKQTFSARIIGKIRDEGIILSGSTNGYKLALSLDDIREYIEHDKNIIEPMLYRLKRARENVKTFTNECYDILSEFKFGNLKDFVDIFTDNKTALLLDSNDEDIAY